MSENDANETNPKKPRKSLVGDGTPKQLSSRRNYARRIGEYVPYQQLGRPRQPDKKVTRQALSQRRKRDGEPPRRPGPRRTDGPISPSGMSKRRIRDRESRTTTEK